MNQKIPDYLAWVMRTSRFVASIWRGSSMPKVSSIIKAVFEKEREFLLQTPEVVLFSACLAITQKVLTLERAFAAGKINRAAFIRRINILLSQLTRTAEATQRFDIVMPVMDFGRFSPTFWRWFNWWDDYRRSLTPTEIIQLERLVQARAPTISDYRPEGDWQTCRQTPPFRLEIVSSPEPLKTKRGKWRERRGSNP